MQVAAQEFIGDLGRLTIPVLTLLILLALVHKKRSMTSIVSLIFYLMLSVGGAFSIYYDKLFWGEHTREIPTAVLYGSSFSAVIIALILVPYHILFSSRHD